MWEYTSIVESLTICSASSMLLPWFVIVVQITRIFAFENHPRKLCIELLDSCDTRKIKTFITFFLLCAYKGHKNVFFLNLLCVTIKFKQWPVYLVNCHFS